MEHKRGLVLSGGAAFGAFQIGALQTAAEMGYNKWDLIAGVSVGALNGSMIALDKFDKLVNIWNNISNNQVYTRRLNAIYIALALILCRQGILGNRPLQRKIKEAINGGSFKIPMLVGTVSLKTGDYHSFDILEFEKDLKTFRKIVLASTSIPVFWPPVKKIIHKGKKYRNMIDGGIRNFSPLKNLVVYDRKKNIGLKEIVVINCDPLKLKRMTNRPKTIIDIGLRALLQIMFNETFIMDIREHTQVNEILNQVHGWPIYKDNKKKSVFLKPYKTHLIQPDTADEMGDSLNFSHRWVQERMRLGWEKAMTVLGKNSKA